MLAHALHLRRGYIRQENIDALAKQFRQLNQKTYRAKAASIRYFGGIQSRGAGSFLYGLTSKREQRSVIKIAYAKNTKNRAWAAHGDYLQRHHAQAEHKKGIGFNAQQAEIDITETLREWQAAGDPHFFKLIIAPENAARLDLRQHIVDLMQTAERDLKSSLEWVAIDHHDTDHAHLHVLIRGLDQQKNPLIIDPLYIAEGFRQRSQTLATNVLGLRTHQDFSLARQREIDKTRFTTIDRSLLAQSKNNIVSYETPIPKSPLQRERRLQEIARLNFLTSLGLAKKVAAKRWVLSDKLEITLRELQLSGDIIKSKARHALGVTPLQELMKPTVIKSGETLVGRVIGMGLDHEIFDKRYLLLDGSDGKLHYIRATESLVKARDGGIFKDGDVIALTGKTFNSSKAGKSEIGQTIQYLHVTNYHSLAALQQAADSRLDQDVITLVKQQGGVPALSSEATDFGKRYREALVVRFEALKAAKLFETQGDHFVLKDNVDSLLDDIVHGRLAPNVEKWTPVLDRQRPDKPLAGKVVASNERVLCIHDSRDQYYQVKCEDLGLKPPKKVDSYLYIRSNRPPGLAFTRTDGRLVSIITKNDCYDPKQHKARLMQQLSQQKDFFLADEKAIDAFVLAHQRRADTWVKWNVLTVKAGYYWPASDRDKQNELSHSLENQMRNVIEGLKAKCLKQPAMVTTLNEETLRGPINRFNLSDKLLSEIGVPSDNMNDWLSQALRRQHECWTQRRVELTQDFEKVARNWLAENPVEITLTSLKQHYQCPVQVVQAKAIKANTVLTGKLVTLEAKDHQDKRFVVLLQEKQLLALPVEETTFRTRDSKVGQTLSVNPVFKIHENRFVCQFELRRDKAHEKTRQSLAPENAISQSRE